MKTYKRKANNQINIYLDDNDYEKLLELEQKTGLTKSAILRNLINGNKLCEAPSLDFWELTKQIRFCGNNMNQIAKRVNMFNSVDVESYQRNADEIFKILNQILVATLKKDK